jgi:hypothetical protein
LRRVQVNLTGKGADGRVRMKNLKEREEEEGT